MKRMYLIVVLIMCISIVCMQGCTSNTYDEDVVEDEIAEDVEEETVNKFEKKVIFKENDAINYFMNLFEYFIKSAEFTNITPDGDNVCYAELNGYAFEIVDLGEDLQVVIETTSETREDGVEFMDEVYHFTLMAMDNSDNSISFDDEDEIFSNHEVNKQVGDLKISVYPDTQYGPGHIEVIRRGFKDKYYEEYLNMK